MRQSGKTTRLVDRAVQSFFEKGYIVIPKKSTIESEINSDFSISEFEDKLKSITKSEIFIDDDWIYGRAQEEFRDRIIERLRHEHRIKPKLENKSSYYIISIK